MKLTKAEEKTADAIWNESLKKAKALFDDGSVEVTKQVSYKPYNMWVAARHRLCAAVCTYARACNTPLSPCVPAPCGAHA